MIQITLMLKVVAKTSVYETSQQFWSENRYELVKSVSNKLKLKVFEVTRLSHSA